MPQRFEGQETPPPFGMSFNDSVALMASLSLSAATMVAPFLHKNFGPRALWGGNMFLAAAGILVCGSYGNGPEVGFWYFMAWIVMVCVRRLQTLWLIHNGAQIHSNYMGDQLPFEGWLLALGGFVIWDVIPGLACILVAGGIGVWGVNAFSDAIDRRRRQRMIDARLEGDRIVPF
jgi:hypothetical protein